VIEETGMMIAEQLEAQQGAVTLSKLAEILGVSYKTVYRWVRNNRLPATKIAGTHWVDPQEVAQWWRNHSTTVVKPPVAIRRRSTKVADVA
jgi:excisionase family DNA binding protein